MSQELNETLLSKLRRGVLAAVLLGLLMALSACQSSTVREVAGQLGSALQTAATLQAGGGITVTPVAPAKSTPRPKATATARPQHGVSGLPTIPYDALPRQAKQTVALIEQGGPFPFDADGSVFQNRERVLPRKATGYYREYTVITPGSNDRGARRIVVGAGGEMYYTDDHYDSFREVIR